jgi:hypothetical protein
VHSEKVPYYILDLLQQVPSVYVPGLGRFDAIFHPAVVDIQHSRIKPPFIEPGFAANEHDAQNILPTYMYYVSGVPEEEAKENINEFVDTVHKKVDAGETYAIERFGSFSKSDAGILHFTPDWDAFNLSFIGLDVIDLHPLKEKSSTDIPLHVGDTATEPLPAKNIPQYEPPSETNWVTDHELPEAEKIVAEVTPVPEPVISDSTSRLWWTILASALFLITILCGYLAWDILSNRDKMSRYIAVTNDTLETSSPDVIIVDTLEFIEEPLPADTVEDTLPQVDEKIPEEIADPCFVVVGAFSNADNVTRMENRLKELGYDTELIRGGALTRVAIRTGCDQPTLQKTLNDARSSVNPDSWIY